MTLRSPQTAPARTDLPWLRRRPHPQNSAPGAGTPAASGAVADFFSGRGPRPARKGQAGAATTPAQPARPASAAGGTSLDLSSSTATPAPAPAPASARAAASGPAATSGGTSLDLDRAPAAPAPERPAKPAPIKARYQPPRVAAGVPVVLTAQHPTVTLSRVQSGVGTLTIQAACSPAVGDLRLGCAFALSSGVTSVVQHASGLDLAPAESRRPVLRAVTGTQFETLTVDLRQVRDLQRAVIYAFSESGAELRWGGTVVVETFGGARVEVPLGTPAGPGVLVPLSVYNLDGELVLRAEQQLVPGPVKDACLAFGFDRITWLDDRTPLTQAAPGGPRRG